MGEGVVEPVADAMWDASLRDHMRLRTRARVTEQGVNVVTSFMFGFVAWDTSETFATNAANALLPTVLVFAALGLGLLAVDVSKALGSQRRALVAHIKTMEAPSPVEESSVEPEVEEDPITMEFFFDDGLSATRSPQEVWALAEGVTSVQAEESFARFEGATVIVQGTVEDTSGWLWDEPRHMQLALRCRHPGEMELKFNDEAKWPAVRSLAKGDRVSVKGRVDWVFRNRFTITDCELLSI